MLERPTVDKILEGLDDPHTDLLSDAEYASLQEHTQGTYSGIGLTVGPAERGLHRDVGRSRPGAGGGHPQGRRHRRDRREARRRRSRSSARWR